MIGFSADALMFMLKRIVEEQGGEVTFATEKDMADTLLYFEGSDDGDKITLKTVRVDESTAGHA